jgi:hypothetical protein
VYNFPAARGVPGNRVRRGREGEKEFRGKERGKERGRTPLLVTGSLRTTSPVAVHRSRFSYLKLNLLPRYRATVETVTGGGCILREREREERGVFMS